MERVGNAKSEADTSSRELIAKVVDFALAEERFVRCSFFWGGRGRGERVKGVHSSSIASTGHSHVYLLCLLLIAPAH